MLKKGVLFLLAMALTLLASPGLAPPVAAAGTLVVDDDSEPCEPAPVILYTHIVDAVAAANPGDIIRVCEGTYTELNVVIDKSLTITGSGPEVTHVRHNGMYSPIFYIQADNVTIEGLDLDATPPPGFSADNTRGIESLEADNVTIQQNEIHNATGTAVAIWGNPTLNFGRVIGNNIHDNGHAVACLCHDSAISGNTVDGAGSQAFTVFGDRVEITYYHIPGGNVPTPPGPTAAELSKDLDLDLGEGAEPREPLPDAEITEKERQEAVRRYQRELREKGRR